MKQRDLELLSSYLDGQLKPSDSARLEARLSSDPSLRTVLDDLRAARGLLRQLPLRKAPRNFTLTPKMVGKNPPLPRTYPAFRFVSALATLLLFFTVGLNFLAPQMASQPSNTGFGGGGAPDLQMTEVSVFSAATEEPALQAPAAEPPPVEAPAATEASAEPAIEMIPLPTETLPAEDAREADSAMAKDEVTEEPAVAQSQPQLPNAVATPGQPLRPPVPITWQIILVGVAVLSALIMLLMRRLAANRWRQK